MNDKLSCRSRRLEIEVEAVEAVGEEVEEVEVKEEVEEEEEEVVVVVEEEEAKIYYNFT